MKKIVILFSAISSLFLLTACPGSGGGGGGGGGGDGGGTANNPPAITSTAITTVTAGTVYTYTVTATDADNQTLTYDLEISPSSMQIGSTTGVITWSTTLADIGGHQIKVSVTDGKATVYQEFTITVSLPPNNPPVITSLPINTATAKIAYSYQMTASDTDGDSLTFSLDIFPVGLTIGSTTGLISWVPTKMQGGDHLVKVKVTDGIDSVYQQYTITVTVFNTQPQITSLPAGNTVIVEQLYVYDVEATDVDGDTLTYSLDLFPTGMTIDTATGLINWTPTLAQEGNYTVRIIVSDGLAAVNQLIVIYVRLPNYPPVIYSSPVTTATSNQIYNYNVNASDSDGDTLVYFLATAPVNMIINDWDGLISWYPRDWDGGDHVVRVGVSDGQTTSYQEYTVTVSVPANPEIMITSEPGREAIVNSLYTYDVQAIDTQSHSLTYSLVDWPSSMSIDSASGLISWTPLAGTVGNHWVTVEVTDGSTSAYQNYTVRVSPTDSGTPFYHACQLGSYWYEDYPSLTTEQTLVKMHQDGCQTVFVLITWYQASISSTDIYRVLAKTPTDAGIIQVTNFAHSLGMEVYFKLHVDVSGDIWRGYITFGTDPEWTAWFASLNNFVGYYFDLAESLGVEGVIIGTEYKATEHRETDWRNSIALGRSKYSGLMSYSANWDSYTTIAWWDALDFIGISAYFPISSITNPTVPQLVAGWQPWINDLSAFHTAWGMDIVFTELGYQSRNGTSMKPDWVNTAQDLQEQADCYQAAFEALYDQNWFKGMSWWFWYWNPSQDVNGFDVYNKPAEDQLTWWYAGFIW